MDFITNSFLIYNAGFGKVFFLEMDNPTRPPPPIVGCNTVLYFIRLFRGNSIDAVSAVVMLLGVCKLRALEQHNFEFA